MAALLLLAVVPAVIVGIVVAALAGGGGGGEKDRSAAVIDSCVHSSSLMIPPSRRSRPLPPGFETSRFSAAPRRSAPSRRVKEGSHFAVLSTNAPPVKVYDYYLGVMDKGPWRSQWQRRQRVHRHAFNSRRPDVEGEVAITSRRWTT